MIGSGRRRASFRVFFLAWGLALLAAPSARAQEKPLLREFPVGTTSGYRVLLTVRTEVEGQQPVQIGAKTYVKPFARSAEGQLCWRASRRVVAVAADGSAAIEETLDGFRSSRAGGEAASGEDEETRKLLRAVQDALANWGKSRALRYRESSAGQLSGLMPEGVPALDEEPPRLVSLWLLRALHPTVALPEISPRTEASWQEPRAVQLPNWADARGSESGEWLPAPKAAEPAMRLHIVQQLTATVVAGAEKPSEGSARARFHGESLNTVSLADGRLLSATRSATREITWTLAAVEGLPDRPQFRGRLSVQVEIEASDEKLCPTPDSDRSAVRRQP